VPFEMDFDCDGHPKMTAVRQRRVERTVGHTERVEGLWVRVENDLDQSDRQECTGKHPSVAEMVVAAAGEGLWVESDGNSLHMDCR